MPLKMMHLRTLLITALPLLVLSSEVQQCSFQKTSHRSSVLDSLQCYNDYTTHIRCTWEEDPHTRLDLVFTKTEAEDFDSACLPDGNEVHHGKPYRSCICKTGVFYFGFRTAYFNTSCPSKAATLNIAQHGKVQSPVNVTVRKVDDGRMLSWSSPYSSSSRLTNSLTYQVKYRRHGQDWTVVSDITATQWVIKEQLLPGYSYEARVRARGRVGLWSEWSPPVSWNTEEEGVFNLQCLILESGVSCSWQVKREQAQVFSFHLCSHANGSKPVCQHCHGDRTGHPVLDFSCLVVASEPETLTVELRSIRNSKDFIYSSNIQPPQPNPVQAKKEEGIWKLTWSKPSVSAMLSNSLSYQLRLQNNNTKDYKVYNLSSADFSLDFPPPTLMPSTTYMAQVRALPSDEFSGRPSNWSKPVYFTSDSASYVATAIYVLTAVFVAVFFIILYNALPACHRRLVLWKVSIPSPIKSRALEEMSSKSSPAGWGNFYSENEKASMCIMQPSDNPIIYKGSISECTLFPYSDDSLIKSEWMYGRENSSSYIEDSGMSVKSVMSFSGPYILCQQDSSSQTETLDTSFYSSTTFDEDSRSTTENAFDPLAVNGGYVSSPPTSLPSTDHSPVLDNPANESTNPCISQLPTDDPPAYTSTPTAMPGVLFSNPSGYCLMPSMEMDVAAWVQASVPSPGGDTEWQSKDAGERDQSARGYVSLSQPVF